jgi:hypothetical protein
MGASYLKEMEYYNFNLSMIHDMLNSIQAAKIEARTPQVMHHHSSPVRFGSPTILATGATNCT